MGALAPFFISPGERLPMYPTMMDPQAMANAAQYGPIAPLMQGNYTRQRTLTLGDLLLENRIVFIGSSPETGGSPVITDFLANYTIQKLLWLVTDKKSADIHLYINSPGGSISAGLAIYDTLQFIDCPVNTYCMGLAASMAAVLLCAGTKGKRFALPNSKTMLHQPYGQIQGQVSDMEIQAQEIFKERERLNQIISKHTGQSLEAIAKETDRDRYFSASEAKEFGLVDEVLLKPPAVKK
jgi:ATP-dependent Clp protease, protease subunit